VTSRAGWPTVAAMARKVPTDSKRIKTTAVPDRIGSTLALGAEARIVASLLRGYGADGAQAVVPGVTSNEERKLWMTARSRPGRAPMWVMDYVLAILDEIPERENRETRPNHRPRDPFVGRVKILADLLDIDIAEAARFVADEEGA
jgi:hypothetical protein